MGWDTVLLVALPLVASFGTLLWTQRFEGRRAERASEQALDALTLQHQQAFALHIFEQRFTTYRDVIRHAQAAVSAASAGPLDDEGDANHRPLRDAETALLEALDDAALIATPPVQAELDEFRKVVFAQRDAERKYADDAVPDTNRFKGAAAQIRAAQAYRAKKDAVRAAMSAEMRGDRPSIGAVAPVGRS